MMYDKVISNMQEIKSRGGKMIAIATEGDEEIAEVADDVVYIPQNLDSTAHPCRCGARMPTMLPSTRL
jgi:glucosamine 6-phosphate synthetase-like amidotransferase/phosphosugar isomerase protein